MFNEVAIPRKAFPNPMFFSNVLVSIVFKIASKKGLMKVISNGQLQVCVRGCLYL
jgi:hypothetical protein